MRQVRVILLSLSFALVMGAAPREVGATCPGICDPNDPVFGPCCDATCNWLAQGTACDDNNVCSKNTTCDGQHQCSGGSNQAGSCLNPNNHCLLGQCDNKQCKPTASGYLNPCDDGNACTVDNCTDTGTTYSCNIVPMNPGDICDTDGTFCTPEHCVSVYGAVFCQSTGAPIVCDQTGNGTCCFKTCDPVDGQCKIGPAPNHTPCPDPTPLDCHDQECDGSACSTTACNNRPASSAGTVCDKDGNPCTRGQCGSSGGCNNEVPITTPDPSTVACATDGNVCTKDVCNGSGSCTHPADSSQENQPCNDTNICTSASLCMSGVCTGTACTAGNCPSGCGSTPCTTTGTTCGCRGGTGG